jgi:hypothetical protein
VNGDQLVVLEQLTDLRDLPLAADEGRPLRRQRVPERLQGAQPRELVRSDLEDVLRLSKVLQAVRAEIHQ